MTGIYTITNIINNKLYVGYSKNIKERWLYHKSHLRRNMHTNVNLQNSWNKYGIDKFLFEVLIECEEEHLASEEHYWCNMLNTHNDKYGYNIRPTDPHRSPKCSPNTSKRISQTKKEQWKDNECRNRMLSNRPCRKGVPRPQSVSDKLSIFWKGRKRTGITREVLNRRQLSCRIDIVQCDRCGNKIKEWKGVITAAKALNIQASGISACLSGKRNYCGGYIWKYKVIASQ